MQGSENGWQYLWNAPEQWSPKNAGRLDTGSIDNPASYVPLTKDPASGFWTADGDTNGFNSFPAGFLKLRFNGGTPGRPAGSFVDQTGTVVENSLDRYSIASYQIERAGIYSISDSHFTLAGLSVDGVEVRVQINTDAPILKKNIAQTVPNEINNTTNFDTSLGYLAKGDKIYVAFGAGDNIVRDFFFTDFTIFRTSSEMVVADYVDDFRSDIPEPGWQYLWNAPTGWGSPGGAVDLTTGSISDPDSFVALNQATARSSWTADGDTNGRTGAPANFLRLGKGVGVPGAPAGMFVQDGQTFTENQLDRFAIAAYSVSDSGYYAITDSFLTTVSPTNMDGVEVHVFVNDGSLLVSQTSIAGNTVDFDVSLGFLKAGDTIYVAYGANTTQNSDFSRTDFSVARILPRVEPLREFQNTTDFFVGPTNGTNDYMGIYQTLMDARVYQETNPGPVTIYLEPNQTYHVSPPVPGSDVVFDLTRYWKDGIPYDLGNIEFDGQGSKILIDDPTSGLMHLGHASHMIIRNLFVDYSILPFTQGTITRVNKATNSIDLRIDAPLPGSFFPSPTDPQFNGYHRSGFSLWGYAVKPESPGELKDDTYWLYRPQYDNIVDIGNNTFRMILPSIAGLETSDRFVLQSRYNRSGLFTSYNDSQQISYINVKAYAGPSTFISGNHNFALNVIDVEAAIMPGRLKSMNADAIHAQSNRIGPWIENSKFAGVSDDIANFYTVPFTVLSQSADRKTFVFGNMNPSLEPADRFANVADQDIHRIGDHLTFYQSVTGEILGEARIVATEYDGARATSVTLDQPVWGVTMEPPGIGNGDDSYLNDTTVYNKDLAAGFLIQGSEFTNSRRFGTFLMAQRGQIYDSLYEGLSNQAIAGHNDTNWPLGLFASDMVIQNNVFRNNGFSLQYQQDPQYAGVVSFNMDRLTADALVDRDETPYSNIYILDNVFEEWRKTAISVRNASGVEIRDNVFVEAEPHLATDVRNQQRNTAIRVAWSENVNISGNQAVDLGLIENYDERFLDASDHVTGLVESGSVDLSAEELAKLLSFSENSGKVSVDRSQKKLNAILVGAQNDAAGYQGSGVSFDGTNDFAFSFDDSTVNEQQNRTLALWVNSNVDTASRKQVIFDSGSIVGGTNVYLCDGRLYFGSWNSPTGPGTWLSVAVDLNSWHHVAFTVSASGQLKAFLDGEDVDSATAGQGVHSNGPGYLGLGAADRNGTRFHDGLAEIKAHSNYFSGRLDEVRIYNRILTEDEIGLLAQG